MQTYCKSIRYERKQLFLCIIQVSQNKALTLSKSNKLILLQPTPPKLCGGNIEHYYHFIFDLVLPLNRLIQKLPKDNIFLLNDFGIFTNRLEDLFPGRTHILSDNTRPKKVKAAPLLGMNPRCVYLSPQELEDFSFNIKHNLGIDHNAPWNQILHIEPIHPHPFYVDNAKKKGAGATRRSILNHTELCTMIQKSVKDGYQFSNLQLENISFRQQVECFNKSKIVFAQHGAGLANCIWMKPNSIVVEFSNNVSLDHFRTISKLKKHKYYFYKTQGEHASIDTEYFMNWLLRHEELRCFFQTDFNLTSKTPNNS